MNWAQVFQGVEQGLGVAVVATLLMLLMAWGVVRSDRIPEEADMGHETRSRGRRKG